MAAAWMIGDANLLYVIKHELKDHGVKIGKLKGNSRTNSISTQFQDKDGTSPVFGVSLADLPCCKDLQTGLEIPRFVRACVDFLSSHLNEEGLFRKSGSHARQKQLQLRLSQGEPIPPDSLVVDVASILKRFLRDLPEPIVPTRYQAAILKCVSSEDQIIQEWTTLLLLCLLPFKNLQLLRYIMLFLAKVSACSENNKMDTRNLAKVLMPTLIGGDSGAGKSGQFERQIRLQTLAVEIMIDNAKDIGMVPDSALDRMKKVKSRSNEALDMVLTGSEDELDELDSRMRRKKRRSGTFQGIANGLGQVGRKVGVLLKPSGSLDNLDQTPEYSVETPRAQRSAKRKASDDIGSFFSATKRSAPSWQRSSLIRRSMRNFRRSSSPKRRSTPSPQRNSMMRRSMRNRRKSSPPRRRKPPTGPLTAERQYQKRGSLKSDPSSPMTPLQAAKPPIGEVDAVDSEGKTLFHFNTPSIKFADDSFSGFTSSPSTSTAAEPHPPGLTPRRNKLKKLNPLNSRRFKSAKETMMSLGTIGGSGRTPHKHPHRQVHPYNYARTCATVGHRLANEPNPEGFDTLHLVPRQPEFREQPVTCPADEAEKEVITAGVIPPPLYLRRKENGVNQKQNGKNTPAKMDSSLDATIVNEHPLGRQLSLRTSVGALHKIALEDSGGSGHNTYQPPNVKCSDIGSCWPCGAAGPYQKIDPTQGEDGDGATPVQMDRGHCGKEVIGQVVSVHPLQYTDSQRSISSILSSITVQSTKSYFSIEAATGMIDRPSPFMISPRDPDNATLTTSSLSPDEMDAGERQGSTEDDETRSEPALSSSQPISRSLQSLHSTPSKEKTAEWILKKTISVDSGRGASIEDLEAHRQEPFSEMNAAAICPDVGETSDVAGTGRDPSTQAVRCQDSSFAKINPSGLRPLKVDHDDSAIRQFELMQRRLHIEPKKEVKSVKQKIEMYNSLSSIDLKADCRPRSKSVSRIQHHSGSDLPSCQYVKESHGGFLMTPRACEMQAMSLSPLIKSVSYDSGLKELGRRQVEEPTTPMLPPSGLRKMSSRSNEEDSFEAAMSSANKVLTHFHHYAAEHSTPVGERRPLRDKNSVRVNQAKPSPVGIEALARENVESSLKRSPSLRTSGSPRVRKQLKRLHSENNPSWQRYSPRRAFIHDNYMHKLKSPRDHHGSPRNPLERRTSRRSRRVRKEWQV